MTARCSFPDDRVVLTNHAVATIVACRTEPESTLGLALYHGKDTMRNWQWKRMALAVLSGTILFQTPGCAEASLGITAIATTVTAGGVIYLIRKVLD
jgi:hypothetical protein